MDTKAILKHNKVIAIVGLSSNQKRPSYHVGEYLLKQGYVILPISLKDKEILGQRAYPSLYDAFSEHEGIGIVNIFRKSEALFGIAKSIMELPYKPQCVWVQLGLSSPEARKLLEGSMAYLENLCIAIEHQRLFA